MSLSASLPPRPPCLNGFYRDLLSTFSLPNAVSIPTTISDRVILNNRKRNNPNTSNQLETLLADRHALQNQYSNCLNKIKQIKLDPEGTRFDLEIYQLELKLSIDQNNLDDIEKAYSFKISQIILIITSLFQRLYPEILASEIPYDFDEETIKEFTKIDPLSSLELIKLYEEKHMLEYHSDHLEKKTRAIESIAHRKKLIDEVKNEKEKHLCILSTLLGNLERSNESLLEKIDLIDKEITLQSTSESIGKNKNDSSTPIEAKRQKTHQVADQVINRPLFKLATLSLSNRPTNFQTSPETSFEGR